MQVLLNRSKRIKMFIVLKYLVVIFFLLGSFVGSLFPNEVSSISKAKTEISNSVTSVSDMASHSHSHPQMPEADCTQQCHTCHSANCFMELCAADAFFNLTVQISNSGYNFNYSYLYSNVLKRPPIFS